MTRKRIKDSLDKSKRKDKKVRKKVDFEIKKNATLNNKIIIIALISFICLTLYLNTYNNYTSGVGINDKGETLGEKYYLAGPDPYYHARIAEIIYYEGRVPFIAEGEPDPMLSYPLHLPNPRPPLFDITLAMGAHALSPFMEDIDALGHSLQFLPAIYGALLVIPVYFIAATLFNKKIGLLAALFVPLIPIHIGSGHGSSYALADHDSFILLLSTCGIFFFVRALQLLNTKYEGLKQLILLNKKTIVYAMIAGIFYGMIGLSWEGFRLFVVILAFYCILQFLINCYLRRDFLGLTMIGVISLSMVALMILPYHLIRNNLRDFMLVSSLVAIVLIAGIVFHLLKKLPSVITIPAMSTVGICSLFLINAYEIAPMYSFVAMFFRGSIYTGKVSLTIAEAGTFPLSRTVMSFGPILYWVAWFGIVIFMARTLLHKKNFMLFISVYIMITFYFTMTAGRFLNDIVPFVAIFAGWGVYFVLKKINYIKMFENIKAIGGFQGIKKGIKVTHILGILFIIMLVLPNAIMSFDASIPYEKKAEYGNEDLFGTFGVSFGKETYWVDAFSWLNEQDTELAPEDRPAFISWWDYGFYCVMIGEHPAVAHNFQGGIQTASNFKTAKSEKEAISVIISRFLFADYHRINNGKKLSDDVVLVLEKYIGVNETKDVSKWLADPKTSPEFNKVICPEYDSALDKKYRKEEPDAYVHSFTAITENLTDEEVTNFYLEMQKVTGWNVRYYGTEQYDTQIFTVFTFLADKSLIPLGALEDKYMKGYLIATHKETKEKTIIYEDKYINLTDYDRENYAFAGPYYNRKSAYYETLFYRVYYGTPVDEGLPSQNERLPTYGLKHFVPKYLSPYVVIAKYYEGAKINGTVTCNGVPMNGVSIIVFDSMGIPHDVGVLWDNKYNVIAPEGNLSLKIFIQNKEINKKDIKITELEATRRADNYNKTVNFEVEPITINGTITKNQTVLPNINVTLASQLSGMFTKVLTDKNGRYVFKDVPPSVYSIEVEQDGNVTYAETVIVTENKLLDIEVD